MSERIWNILVEGFVKIMLASIKVTIPLTVLGFSFAMIIAMFMAMVQYAKVPVLRQLSRLYIWIFRGTPLLVQLFLAYYGFPKIGIVLNSFVCAVIVFSLNEGAYCAETMRSALEAVPEGQMEAGYCVGMNYLQIMRHVVIPQALRTAFPPLSNSVIAMLKDTSLVAEITVADMFMAAQKNRSARTGVRKIMEIRELRKSFGANTVLKGIDLTVEKGDVIAILGPSGSGKTTLLRCINFLEKSDSGTMIFDNETYDLGHMRKADIAAIRKNTAFVFQNYNLFANLTALGNVTLGLTSARKMDKEKARQIGMEMLDKVGLSDRADYYPIQLSGGQQQRVAIAPGDHLF